MKYVFITAFILSITAAIGGFVVDRLGRADLSHLCGAIALVGVGIVFMSAPIMNATSVGFSWMLGIGFVSRHERPVWYRAALGISFVVGLGMLIGGLYLLIVKLT
jgi:hypothetical protein